MNYEKDFFVPHNFHFSDPPKPIMRFTYTFFAALAFSLASAENYPASIKPIAISGNGSLRDIPPNRALIDVDKAGFISLYGDISQKSDMINVKFFNDEEIFTFSQKLGWETQDRLAWYGEDEDTNNSLNLSVNTRQGRRYAG